MDEDDAVVDGIKSDYTKLPLTASERAVLDYSVKLTATPWLVGEEDIRELRGRGFDDRDILYIIHVTCRHKSRQCHRGRGWLLPGLHKAIIAI